MVRGSDGLVEQVGACEGSGVECELQLEEVTEVAQLHEVGAELLAGALVRGGGEGGGGG